tara:strand:+ start:129 stop:848 length:720 start_codon:yes stop_codon:yes gene_type:complete
MGQNMLVFHNDSDVSYANYAGNLSSMSSATTAVTLRFSSTVGTSAANDIIVLTVTAGQEEAVMEALSGAIAEARSGMTVVADDKNSKYLVPGITALNSISVDNGSGTFKSLIPATFTTADTGGTDNAIIVTNADSGSEFVVTATTDAASVITLPSAPIDGFNARFSALIANGAHTITIAGAFYGVTLQAGDTVEHALGTTSAVIAASDFKKGDFFDIIYTGSAYHISGMFDTAASLAVS